MTGEALRVSEFKAHVSNLDNRITVLASRVLPLLISPSKRRDLEKQLALPEVQKANR